MDFNGGLAGVDFRRDLLVEKAGDEQWKDLTFARSQRSHTPLELPDLFLTQTSKAVVLEGRLNGINQVLVVKGFNQEFDGSGLHGFHAHGDVSVGGDEDNGNPDVGLTQLTLKIDSADSWQSHVEN